MVLLTQGCLPAAQTVLAPEKVGFLFLFFYLFEHFQSLFQQAVLRMVRADTQPWPRHFTQPYVPAENHQAEPK